MAYDDFSEFPRGLWSDDLGSDRDVANIEFGDTAHVMKVAWMVLSNDNVAAQYINILDTDDTLRGYLYVPADDSVVLPFGFQMDGLKIEMDANTADVVVTIAYWTP
jgi:hypothetical protein